MLLSLLNRLSNKDVGEKVLGGLRLSKPDICPQSVWNFIKRCFEADPAARPSFAEIAKELQKLRHAQIAQKVESEYSEEITAPTTEYYNVTPTNYLGENPPQNQETTHYVLAAKE